MRIHKIRHNGKGWKCQFCSETYKIRSRLKNHLVISHDMTEEVIEIFGILKLANKFVVMKKLKSSKIPAEKSKPLLSDSDLDSDETEDDDDFCIYDDKVSNLSDGMMATLTPLTKSQPIHGPSPTQWSSSESRRPVIKCLSDLDTFTCRPCNNYFKNPQCFKFHRNWH